MEFNFDPRCYFATLFNGNVKHNSTLLSTQLTQLLHNNGCFCTLTYCFFPWGFSLVMTNDYVVVFYDISNSKYFFLKNVKIHQVILFVRTNVISPWQSVIFQSQQCVEFLVILSFVTAGKKDLQRYKVSICFFTKREL